MPGDLGCLARWAYPNKLWLNAARSHKASWPTGGLRTCRRRGIPDSRQAEGVWGPTATSPAVPQRTRRAARACRWLAPCQPLAQPVLPDSPGCIPGAVGVCKDGGGCGTRLRLGRRSSCGVGELRGGRMPGGAGSLEGPSVEERKLEENKWLEQEPGEQRQQLSRSPHPCRWLVPASGHQRPKPGAPLQLVTTVAGTDHPMPLAHPRLPCSPLAVPAASPMASGG